MADEKPKSISYEDAATLIPDTAFIQTFREIDGEIVGNKMHRKEILMKMQKFPIELSGSLMRSKGFGICVFDDLGCLFIQDKAAKYGAPSK